MSRPTSEHEEPIDECASPGTLSADCTIRLPVISCVDALLCCPPPPFTNTEPLMTRCIPISAIRLLSEQMPE